ncbi:MAG: hypothetical protein E7113_04325 [Bacteroidales bacterium]|nr:hypothetical protein [Bacteroidales bacterium]
MKKNKERMMSGSDIVMEGKIWIDKNGVRRRFIDPMTDKGFKLLFGSKGISDPLLKEVYDKGEIAALPEYLRITYINYIMSRNDELNSRAEMIEDALAKGREEGIVIGREETKSELAKKLKKLGIGIEIITEVTGLDEEMISGL